MSNEPPKPWIRDERLGTGDLNTTFGHRPHELTLNHKSGCEEMNPHFFTATFYFAFIWFRVQGSGFRVQGSGGGFAVMLDDGILISQPSPLGEGVPQR